MSVKALKLFILILFSILISCISCYRDFSAIEEQQEQHYCQIPTDTTSHDFSWHVDTLGIFPSALYDVAAIDPNNVWAVGIVNTPEPDTVWHFPYTRNNAVKWNGSEYEYYQLEVLSAGGNPSIQDLRIVMAFSTEDIWFISNSGSYVKWNGTVWESAFIFERKGTPTEAWGISSEDFFIVGTNGSITHYDGHTFTLMESGTDKDLHDVTGYVDPETGLTHVWAAGQSTLLHYDGMQWETVWDIDNPLLPDNYNHPGAIFAPNQNELLVAAWYPQTIRGYCINTKNVKEFKELFIIDLYAYAIDGPAINDFFIVGSWNKVVHFNGSSIKGYPELNTGSNRSVSYKNDNVFVVGPLAEQLGLFIRGTKK